MRKLIALAFVTLDGIMQAPGGPEEDTSGDFKHGGWSVGYWDDALSEEMGKQMGHEFDMLVGRRTYDVFSEAWPKMDPKNVINSYKKYVVTHRPLPADTKIWKNSIQVKGDVIGEIKKLKQLAGPEIQVHGSISILQMLLKNDLVDELWLKIYPVTIGKGKRLFGEGVIPAGWELVESKSSPSGVIVAKYKRAGKIKIGSFAPESK